MAGFNFDGLDKFKKKMEALKNTDKVAVKDLFTPEFLGAHTQFGNLETFEKMVTDAGFQAGSPKQFKSNYGPKWDAFIKQHSTFGTWEEMKDAAMIAWVKRQLK